MKRVICIDDSVDANGLGRINGFYIKEGEIYTALRETLARCTDGARERVYELAEDRGYGYAVTKFIPLSEIDETQFERNYQKEKV